MYIVFYAKYGILNYFYILFEFQGINKELIKNESYKGENIEKTYLNKDYIDKITDKDLKELEQITNKYKSIYVDTIDYILI